MSDDLSGERWTESDDVAVLAESIPVDHPVNLTMAFKQALDEIPQYRYVLEQLVTPESLEQWGDFSSAAELVADLSVNTVARSYSNSPDVAYVYAVQNEPDGRLLREAEVVQVAQFFTWVWRPELNSWRLHLISPMEPPLNVLPRTSPGAAPDIGSVPPSAA